MRSLFAEENALDPTKTRPPLTAQLDAGDTVHATPNSAPVTRFFLATLGENENSIELRRVLIQRDIAPRAAPYDEFPLPLSRGSANLRTRRQDIEGVQHLGYPIGRTLNVMIRKVIADPVEIVKNSRKQFDPRHQRGVFRARGRVSFFPLARACK